MALYAQQMAALDKHWGKGQQKLTVEHIHVHSGGQAIVGHVERGGERKPQPSGPPALRMSPKPRSRPRRRPDRRRAGENLERDSST